MTTPHTSQTLAADVYAIDDRIRARLIAELGLDYEDRHSLRRITTPLLASVVAYVLHGQETGGFLRAVLENNLRDAVARADGFSMMALPGLAMLLMNSTAVPDECWGSPDRVDSWLARRREQVRGAIMRDADDESTENLVAASDRLARLARSVD